MRGGVCGRDACTQWECAETDFSLAVKNKKDYAAAFCARAAVEMDLGWFTNAIDDCTHAIRINPGAPLRESPGASEPDGDSRPNTCGRASAAVLGYRGGTAGCGDLARHTLSCVTLGQDLS